MSVARARHPGYPARCRASRPLHRSHTGRQSRGRSARGRRSWTLSRPAGLLRADPPSGPPPRPCCSPSRSMRARPPRCRRSTRAYRPQPLRKRPAQERAAGLRVAAAEPPRPRRRSEAAQSTSQLGSAPCGERDPTRQTAAPQAALKSQKNAEQVLQRIVRGLLSGREARPRGWVTEAGARSEQMCSQPIFPRVSPRRKKLLCIGSPLAQNRVMVTDTPKNGQICH